MGTGRMVGRVVIEALLLLYVAMIGLVVSDSHGNSPLWFGVPFLAWVGLRLVLAKMGLDIVSAVLDWNERLEKRAVELQAKARAAGPSPYPPLFFGALALCLILYGLALVGAQSWHWLRTAEWVSVPASTLMISKDYRGADEPAPLRLVPALGGKSRTDEPNSPTGRMLGWEKIKGWLADLPLALWAVVLGVGVLVVSSRD